MGLFSKSKEGGIMDVIRCDQKDFLIWKWRPDSSAAVGESRKENSIRYGSSLRVRPGQAAVLLYQNRGDYDVIVGPYDDVIKTDNFPVLASIVGLAYKGSSPFQAEVYYINLAKGMELPFTVPFFRVIPSEPEYKVYDIQVAIRGSLTFEIPAQKELLKYFIEAWGSSDTTMRDFEVKMKSLLTQEVKRVVTNAPKDTGIFVMHFNSLIGELGPYICSRIQEPVAHRFGVYASGINIEDIRYDEDSDGYQALKRLTQTQTQIYNLENEKTALLSFEIKRQTMQTDADVRNETVRRMAQMQMDHTEDLAARMRAESQFAQHAQSEQAAKQAGLASESAYINAHAIDRQAEVLKAGMEGLGQMGSMNFGGGDSGMNPAGMMTGMMMGAAVGGQAANMMKQMGQTLSGAMGASSASGSQTPPPLPSQQPVQYYLAIDAQQFGPCDITSISRMVAAGQVSAATLGWCAGMADWKPLSEIPSLARIFSPASQAPAPGCPPPIPQK